MGFFGIPNCHPHFSRCWIDSLVQVPDRTGFVGAASRMVWESLVLVMIVVTHVTIWKSCLNIYQKPYTWA